MTELLFNDDAYLKSCQATILQINAQGVVLDRTVFYAQGGGQPGDSGYLVNANGEKLRIINTVKDQESGQLLHLSETAATDGFRVGDPVSAEIDWQRRHEHMRMHTGLHLLCSLIDAPVTGGSVSAQKSRLDFDLPEMNIDKLVLTEQLKKKKKKNIPVSTDTISDQDLQNNPQLVRTMSVAPPMGQGSVRLIHIEGVDLQPCGGTHVRSTGEIGKVRISKIEKKGRQNRRVNLVFGD
ncbi:MAG: alanyl-tRNA editing protein [Gammaproteobacteria bacterium]|nr:alanyl-tRNA editing protein [Gammaproteobacteria bacterium]